MKNDPTPPPAPDPTQTANAQSHSNIETAIANARLNRVNQQTPWGSITYTQGPADANGVPTWSSNIQLSPEQQQLLTQQQQQQMQRNGMASNFLGQIPTTPLDFGALPGVVNRGQVWNGNPQHAPQGGMPQGGGMPGGMPMGAPAGPPARGPAPSLEQLLMNAPAGAMGQQPAGSQPSSVTGSPVLTPPGTPSAGQPKSAPSFAPTYDDYVRENSQGSEGGNQLLTREQFDALPDAQKWGYLGYGSGGMAISQQSGDPRYQALAQAVGGGDNSTVNVMPGKFGSNYRTNDGTQLFTDPSQVHQFDGFYASPSSNATPEAQDLRGMSDLQMALAAISMLGGGYLAGSGALSGAGAGGMDAIQAGENVGSMGPNAFDFSTMANMPPSSGVGELGGGAPVTDLSTQAQSPSLWRQAMNNFTSGKGILGLTPAQRAAVGVLPSLLRGTTRSSGGGGH